MHAFPFPSEASVHVQEMKVAGAPVMMVPVATASVPAGYQVSMAPQPGVPQYAPAPGMPQYTTPGVPQYYPTHGVPPTVPGAHPGHPQYTGLRDSKV